MKVITNSDLKKWKRKVDNKMHAFGETDFGKKEMKVNKKKSKNSGRTGEVLDTIVHEAAHVKHPMMHEKTIRKHTKKVVKKLSKQAKRNYYNLF